MKHGIKYGNSGTVKINVINVQIEHTKYLQEFNALSCCKIKIIKKNNVIKVVAKFFMCEIHFTVDAEN